MTISQDSNSGNNVDISSGEKLESQVAKLTIADPPSAPIPSTDPVPLSDNTPPLPISKVTQRLIICKLAYGSRAVTLLTHEAHIYHSKLRSL